MTRRLFLVSLTLLSSLSAATFTWDDGGGDDEWTTATNWVGDSVPTQDSNNTSIIFADNPGGEGLHHVAFSGSSRQFSDMTFNSSDLAYKLTGPTAGTVFLDVNSTPTFTVSSGFHFIEAKVNFLDNATIQGADTAKLSWNALDLVGTNFDTVTNTTGSGTFVFEFESSNTSSKNLTGDLALGANTITNITNTNGGGLNVNWGTAVLSGSGTITLDAGSADIQLGGGTSSNTHTGEMIIREGRVRFLKNSNATVVNGSLTVEAGGIAEVEANGDMDSASTATFYGGTFDVDASTVSFDSITLEGGAEIDFSDTTSSLTLSNGSNGLLRNAGGTINVTGTLDGTDTLLISNGTSTGYMGAWAHANGTDFAEYHATNGIVAYNSYTDDSGTLTSSVLSNLTADVTQNSAVTVYGLKLTSGDDISGTGTITLDENSAGEQTGIVKSGATTSTISNSITIGSNADEMIVRVNDSNESLTISGSIAGTNKGLVKSGDGTLNLTATNTYTGTSYVNEGTLNLNQGGGGNNTIVGNAIILNGGTLMLGASEEISDNTNMTLNGGTFDTDGFDESLGTLTLQRNSVIDLGSSTSILTFSSLTESDFVSNTLEIHNWTGTVDTAGGTDQLLFSSTNNFFYFNDIHFYSDSGSTQVGIASKMIGNELVASSGYYFTTVPEPSTYFTLLGLSGLAGWHAWRRQRRKY